MTNKINLNADMGESYGSYTMGNDAALLNLVGSANIACGFHAGDPTIMRETVRLARQSGVGIGAHPSFPDLNGFGRRAMAMDLPEIEGLVIYQVGALTGVASAEGMTVTHVKPHGALNNLACENMSIASAIARAVKAVSESLILLAPTGSCLYQAGLELELPTASEIFADRAYDESGNLVPRSQPGAVIHDPEKCIDNVLRLLGQGVSGDQETEDDHFQVHSVCVHGDTLNALQIAHRVRKSLQDQGFEFAGLPEVLNSQKLVSN